MSIQLINNPIIWEGRDLKIDQEPQSWSIKRILRIAVRILLYIPRWCYRTAISLILVPAQVMKTKIFRAIDPIGIIRETFIPPPNRLRDSCIDRNYTSFDLQPIKLRTNTGSFITGTFFRSKRAIEDGKLTKENIPTVICFNPNSRPHTNWAHNFNDPLDYIEKADKLGHAINVVMIDYPGVGNSDGMVSSKSVREAAKTVHQFTKDELNVALNNIHIHGWSFGGFVAGRLAATRDQTSHGLLIIDKSGISIEKVPSELLKRVTTRLEQIPLIGKAIAIIPMIAQDILSTMMANGKWDRLDTLENIEKTDREIIAIYDEDDEVFDEDTSPGPALEKYDYSQGFSRQREVTVLNVKPYNPELAFHHGMALNHCTGITQDGEEINDITKHIVDRIIEIATTA